MTPINSMRSSGAPTNTPSQMTKCRLNRDRRLDGRMGLVGFQGEVLELELEQLLHRRIEPHAREGARRAGELLARLREVVEIQVRVAEREDEFGGLEPRDLRHHQREKTV